jgi:hypothetical protein
MGTSVFNTGFFRVISDGEKIVLLRDSGGKRECVMLNGAILTRWNLDVHQPMHRIDNFGGEQFMVAGIRDVTVDLTLKGGEVRYIDHPLVMGVDIFDRLSVTDYLDIIKGR